MADSMSKTAIVCVGLAVTLTTGCIAPYQYASGPLNLNPAVEKGLSQWAEKTTPGTFAVTPDGNGYGYSYCRDIRCSGHEEAIALYSCEQRKKGDCIIYAKEGRYVWNDEKVK